jgi:hypothetical protein
MKKSKLHQQAEDDLPIALRDTFNLLVKDYQDSSEKRTSDHSRRVSYNIIADLVIAGWRKPVSA